MLFDKAMYGLKVILGILSSHLLDAFGGWGWILAIRLQSVPVALSSDVQTDLSLPARTEADVVMNSALSLSHPYYFKAWHIEWTDVSLPVSLCTTFMKSRIYFDNIFFHWTDRMFPLLFVIHLLPRAPTC
jgi:hypothetical protein